MDIKFQNSIPLKLVSEIQEGGSYLNSFIGWKRYPITFDSREHHPGFIHQVEPIEWQRTLFFNFILFQVNIRWIEKYKYDQ